MSSPPNAKRQKVRKGTHSCWECKRRKMKCIFNPPSNTICRPCQNRGSKCVSQELPENVWISEAQIRVGLNSHAGSNIHTDEGKKRLTTSENGKGGSYGILTPVSTITEASDSLGLYQSPKQHSPNNGVSFHNLGHPALETSLSRGRNGRLSQFLHESLPSRRDIETICQASGRPFILAHEILTTPYVTLDKIGLKTTESLLDIPESNRHPVLIARYMLQLATVLQHVHPDLHKEIMNLSETPRATMERLAYLAINLVTIKDELMGSIEGLECVMIESMYQANIGSLRRSWVSNRRAMGIAQLMGLDRFNQRTRFEVLDPNTKCDPQLMWFRIVFLDRQLCLMLGLPQGCMDRGMASDAILDTESPIGRLERIHCVLLSKILERNASNSEPKLHEYPMTQTLDLELQKAARRLPSKWWLVPNLEGRSTDSQALFWDTRRLFAQVLHYNLLNYLHLPYMLRSSSSGRKYEYSRITCVNASREVLSRFITVRSFNRIAYSCRTVDFLALMAAMTLLLAHLDSHHSEAENILAHQYLSDRAMIEQAQENMQEVNSLNSDAMSAQSAELLSRLLAIEIDMSGGARRVSVQGLDNGIGSPDQSDESVVTVNIPYFGIVKIASGGMTKEAPRCQHPQHQQTISISNHLPRVKAANMPSAIELGAIDGERGMLQPEIAATHEMVNIEDVASVNPMFGNIEATAVSSNPFAAHTTNESTANIALQTHDVFSDPFYQNPGLTAGGQDWAFQGVDMAFFDSLMKSTGNCETGDIQWSV